MQQCLRSVPSLAVAFTCLLAGASMGCALVDPTMESPTIESLTIRETPASIIIQNGEAHVLTYHKAEVEPPAGVSPLYRRSGFIHPLTAPNGSVVTGIHPKDHCHHLGLWHAWVKTIHKGRKIDFWNLKTGDATIRYVKTLGVRRSATVVGFTVMQHHVILPDEVVLEEAFSIDVSLHPDGHYLVDYVTVQENVSDAALVLEAYRYGGCIAYRGPSHWHESNSAYLTSAGRGRKDGHQSRARWCAMYGETEHGVAAVTILGHPNNHDAPQRQRIWPATQQNKGAMFFNFVPIQETAWALRPGKPCTQRYRIVLSAGTPEPAQADAWFATYVR